MLIFKLVFIVLAVNLSRVNGEYGIFTKAQHELDTLGELTTSSRFSLYQCGLKAPIPNKLEWYGVVTGAIEVSLLNEVFENMDDDTIRVLETICDSEAGKQLYVNEDAGNAVNWFELNGKNFTRFEDIFYLSSSDLEAQSKIPDVVILQDGEVSVGNRREAPLIVFYGDGESAEFEDFNRILYNEALGGKIRLVWRLTGDLRYHAS